MAIGGDLEKHGAATKISRHIPISSLDLRTTTDPPVIIVVQYVTVDIFETRSFNPYCLVTPMG